MRVVICDDEKSTCGELEKSLLKYAKERGLYLQVEVFFSGEELYSHLRHEETDILFLDIRLPGKDGVELGKYIRNELENNSMFLIYISSVEQYALKLFQNRPFDFLIKPIHEKQLYTVMDNVYRVAGNCKNCFEYQNQKIYFRIPYKDILYFQSTGRRINLVTSTEIKSFYGKLTDLEDKLPGDLFLKIHKSFLVNLNQVKEFAYEELKMMNGDVLNISKAHRTQVRKKILERAEDEFMGD